MTYVASRETLLLHGGSDGTRRHADIWEIALTSATQPGDLNCDGTINAFDVEPFLDLLFGNGEPCAPCTGDANDDGDINAFDIEPFLNCLFP